MAKRDVIWTKTADLQFVGVLEYWVNRTKSISFSKKLISLVERKTKQISRTPYIYPESGFKDHRIANVKDFCIFYKVTETEIIITAFWDNRQDPEKLLNLLK